ncbi:hypothetical protein Tco_0052202 [Tanacetum coccineum]
MELLNGLHAIGKKTDIATLETYLDSFVKEIRFAMNIMNGTIGNKSSKISTAGNRTNRSFTSSDSEVDSCSKTCVKAYASLKEQYDNLSSDYKKSQFNLVSYKADEKVEKLKFDVTTVVTPSNNKTVENKGVSNTVKSNAVRMNNTSAPIIEDWNSDDKSDIDYNVRPSTKKIKSVKTVRETDAPKQNKQYPRGNQRN